MDVTFAAILNVFSNYYVPNSSIFILCYLRDIMVSDFMCHYAERACKFYHKTNYSRAKQGPFMRFVNVSNLYQNVIWLLLGKNRWRC